MSVRHRDSHFSSVSRRIFLLQVRHASRVCRGKSRVERKQWETWGPGMIYESLISIIQVDCLAKSPLSFKRARIVVTVFSLDYNWSAFTTTKVTAWRQSFHIGQAPQWGIYDMERTHLCMPQISVVHYQTCQTPAPPIMGTYLLLDYPLSISVHT